MEVFNVRTNLYAKIWTSNKNGKSGYLPVCKNEFSTYKCDKARGKYNECPFRELTLLIDDIILKICRYFLKKVYELKLIEKWVIFINSHNSKVSLK